MNRMKMFLLVSTVSVMAISAKTEVRKEAPMPGQKVLISIGGEPYLTEQGFEEFLEQVKESEPQLSVYMQMDPDGIREQLLKAKKQEAIMNAWAKKEKVTDKTTYKTRKKIGEDALHSMLVHQEFVEAHKAEPTITDAKKFYEENKTKDPNLGTPGGVTAKGLKFSTDKAAVDFNALLKKDAYNIDKLAEQDKNLDVQDLGLISEGGFSFVDPKIKEVVVANKTFPTSNVVKVSDNEYWVVISLEEQKPEFEPFEQVKDAIMQQLAGQHVEAMFEREVPKYEKEFKVKTHPENLTKHAAAQPKPVTQHKAADTAPKAPKAHEAPKAPHAHAV
ncbi:hypothetical protein HOM50_00735 [bacterium]|jgi:hypothetical protein|nr:hypothetical protein [bacterium]MBT5014917.1 hypothetical protein [bacterium]